MAVLSTEELPYEELTSFVEQENIYWLFEPFRHHLGDNHLQTPPCVKTSPNATTLGLLFFTTTSNRSFILFHRPTAMIELNHAGPDVWNI